LAKQTVVGILKNRVYTGVFKYGSPEYHQGTYEPLISVEVYDKVQTVMGWLASVMYLIPQREDFILIRACCFVGLVAST